MTARGVALGWRLAYCTQERFIPGLRWAAQRCRARSTYVYWLRRPPYLFMPEAMMRCWADISCFHCWPSHSTLIAARCQLGASRLCMTLRDLRRRRHDFRQAGLSRRLRLYDDARARALMTLRTLECGDGRCDFRAWPISAMHSKFYLRRHGPYVLLFYALQGYHYKHVSPPLAVATALVSRPPALGHKASPAARYGSSRADI